MASPFSIGDALLLAKIAWKLGKAFRKGRKSSISEFREVENQLYGLSAALSALHDSGLARDGDCREALCSMLENCNGTLSHLQSVVDKYGTLGETREETGGPVFKRWSSRLQRDWQAIKWTTEGGDPANMRDQLMVHVNSLNLIMGVTNNLQSSRTREQLSELMVMMRDLRVLLEQGRQLVAVNSTSPAGAERSVLAPVQQLPFRLDTQVSSGIDLICSCASVHPLWSLKSSRAPNQLAAVAREARLFVCGCSAQGSQTSGTHQHRLDAFTLSPFSFAIREAGQRLTWLLYKMSDMRSNTQISLVVEPVHPARMIDFEDLFIEALSVEKAIQMLRRNLHTDLAYASTNANGEDEAHMLDLISDVAECSKMVSTVTFTAQGNNSYTRSDVEGIEILHYRKAKLSVLHASEGTRQFVPHEDAEIVLRYSDAAGGTGDSDVSTTSLRLTHTTHIAHQPGDNNVVFPSIDCTGYDSSAVKSKVEITFSTSQAAHDFRNRCLNMHKELFLLSLKRPSPCERPVFQLQAGAVHTEKISIAECEVTVVQDVGTGTCRLIVVSHDGRTVISQRPPDFMNSGNDGLNFRSLTWVFQVGERGELVQTRYRYGFQHFILSEIRTQEMFRMWASSRSTQSLGRARHRNITDN